jgi:CRP-like cAMP-binding protein
MNLQEVFKKIEMALTPSEDATPEVQAEVQEEVKVEMATMKLAGGVVVEAESFEAGENVFLLGEDDEKVAAPVGEHELEDGRILVIVEEGVIAEIREAGEEVAEEVVEEEATEEVMEEQEMAYVTKEEFGAAIDELKEMIAGMMPKEEQSADEVSEEVEMSTEEVEMSADEAPAAKKVAAAPVDKKPDMVKFSNKAGATTLSRVMSKLS